MMEMGTEIGTGGDGDDDFPIHYDRAQLFFLLQFPFPGPFFRFSYIFPIKRHDKALTRMKMKMTMVYECASSSFHFLNLA